MNEEQSDLAQMVRLALAEQAEDVRLFAARLVRKYRGTAPDLAEQLELFLKSMAARRLAPLLPSKLLITAVRSSTYSGTFNCAASQRAVSVLPTPGGPTKMAERVGVSPMA